MTTTVDSIIPLLVGGALLFFGGRFYWLVAGGVGFLFGANIASASDGGVITGSAVALGLLFGFIAAVTAVVATKFVLAASGFIIGGIFLVQLMEALGWDLGSALVAFLLGGIAGLILVIAAQDWALVIISAILGASIIVNSFVTDPDDANFVYTVLVITGIVFQYFFWIRRK